MTDREMEDVKYYLWEQWTKVVLWSKKGKQCKNCNPINRIEQSFSHSIQIDTWLRSLLRSIKQSINRSINSRFLFCLLFSFFIFQDVCFVFISCCFLNFCSFCDFEFSYQMNTWARKSNFSTRQMKFWVRQWIAEHELPRLDDTWQWTLGLPRLLAY